MRPAKLLYTGQADGGAGEKRRGMSHAIALGGTATANQSAGQVARITLSANRLTNHGQILTIVYGYHAQ